METSAENSTGASFGMNSPTAVRMFQRSATMQPLVRRAEPEDAESIAQVHIQTWQTAYRGQLPDGYLDGLSQELDHRTEIWRAHISAPRTSQHEIWVAGTGAQVQGFAALGPGRGTDPSVTGDSVTGEIYAIYVIPELWGQGLGRALFRHATSRLVSFGFSTAILWVLESNARARRFYEIAGWVLDGGAKVDSGPGGVELREVSYRIYFRREHDEQ